MAEINGYGFGRVVIDGREQTRDVIVLPERVVSGWWRTQGDRLVVEDLGEVLDELPDRLLSASARTSRCGLIRARSRRCAPAGSTLRCCRPRRRFAATPNSIRTGRRRRCI